MPLALPPIIGHRGAAAYAPENTLASFRKAAALGCRMVEFDVRLSADNIPMVFHDDRLERCTDGSGWFGAHNLAQLKRLDAGNGESIPTLAETLECCAALGLAVNIELKPDRGAEAETARLALEAAGKVWAGPPPLVSSFRPACLEIARAVAPHWPRGLLAGRLPRDWRRQAEALDCASINLDQRWLGAATCLHIQAFGLAVLAYTVNRPTRAKVLWNRGVGAVFSDAPDRLFTALSL